MNDQDTPATDPAAEAADAAAAHDADRPPTPEEERLAEQSVPGIDQESVSRHEREMAERGASVEGEGQITPT